MIVKRKQFQNNIILQLKTAISQWKEETQLKNKKYHNEYIITSQIINEETKEYFAKQIILQIIIIIILKKKNSTMKI